MIRAITEVKSLRLLTWIVAKNATHPFRSLMAWHLQRRHARFDRRAGVHTTGTVSIEELGLLPGQSVRYEATPVAFFHSVLARLPLDYPKTTFIDLGCGKGRTLLLASHYPFMSIIGIEISPALCRVAIDNVEKYWTQDRSPSNISVVCNAIDEFEYGEFGITDHVLVYLFNPCSASVLSSTVEKLARLVARKISVTLIYLNPVWLEVLTRASWLKQTLSGETFDEPGNSFMPYVVFQGVPPPWEETLETLFF